MQFIEAIAGGASKSNEIATKIGEESAAGANSKTENTEKGANNTRNNLKKGAGYDIMHL